MNFIIPFYDPIETRYSLVGSFQTISSLIGKIYCHYEIHSGICIFKNSYFEIDSSTYHM